MNRFLFFLMIVAMAGCRRPAAPDAAPTINPVIRDIMPAEPADFGEPIPARDKPPAPEQPPQDEPIDAEITTDEQPAETILDPIRFDEKALIESFPETWEPPTAAPSRRVQFLHFFLPNCTPCVVAKNDLSAWVTPSGWVLSEDDPAAHFLMINAETNRQRFEEFGLERVPAWVLLVDGRETLRFTEYPGRKALVAAFNAASLSLPKLMMTAEPGSFAAGEVDHSFVADLLAFFGSSPGPFALVNDQYELHYGSVTITIPAKVAGEYTVTGAVKRLQFAADKKVRFGWWKIQSSVDAVTFDGKRITAELPGLWDPSLEVIR